MAKLKQKTRNDQSSNISTSSVKQDSSKRKALPKPDAVKVTAPKTRNKPTKVQSVITILRRKKGATLAELATATGWQQHSVRGLISGTIRKKLKLDVVVARTDNSATRYRIVSEQKVK